MQYNVLAAHNARPAAAAARHRCRGLCRTACEQSLLKTPLQARDLSPTIRGITINIILCLRLTHVVPVGQLDRRARNHPAGARPPRAAAAPGLRAVLAHDTAAGAASFSHHTRHHHKHHSLPSSHARGAGRPTFSQRSPPSGRSPAAASRCRTGTACRCAWQTVSRTARRTRRGGRRRRRVFPSFVDVHVRTTHPAFTSAIMPEGCLLHERFHELLLEQPQRAGNAHRSAVREPQPRMRLRSRSSESLLSFSD